MRMTTPAVCCCLSLFILALGALTVAQQVKQESIQCVSLPDGTTLATAGCNTTTSITFGYGTSAPGFVGTALGYQTSAAGFAATSLGQSSSATGAVAFAYGYQTVAGGATSLAGGSGSQTFSDPTVPGGSSAGGAVSLGLDCKSTGDWSLSFGSHSEASGYTSAAIGSGAIANTWGEVALGLYPEEANLTDAQKRNQSVIPTFREEDVVLRVGNGCQKLDSVGGIGCDEDRRSDALRVYKSGQLYLKKLDGTTVEDVAAEITALRQDVDGLGTVCIALAVVCCVLVVMVVMLTALVFVMRKSSLNKFSMLGNSN